MLDTIVSAVIKALEEEDIRAAPSYAEAGMNLEAGPLVCVGIKKSRALSSGIGEYLGLAGDYEQSELYGMRLEVTIGLDIYSAPGKGAGAQDLTTCFGKASSAIKSLPSGLKIRETHLGQTEFDKQTEAFRCRAEWILSCYLTCELDQETGLFRDFKLEGVLKNVKQ